VNLRQLRYLCQVIDSGFSITEAARKLCTSQPGISKQLAVLERQLNVDILVRRGNRIVGVTEPGKAVLQVARRMLTDADNLQHISDKFGMQDSGQLIVGTTHTMARYILPEVIRRFMERYPKVQLVIRQDSEGRMADLVSAGQVDIGITAAPREPHPDLLTVPCYKLQRSVFAPPQHPVLRLRKLTLRELARYPIIILDASSTGGRIVLGAFAAAGIKPNVVMSAIDPDVIKYYVEFNLGIAILPTATFDPQRDKHLRARDAQHLFEPTLVCLQIKREHYLLQYVANFIQFLAPQLTPPILNESIVTGSIPKLPIPEYPPVSGAVKNS